MATNFLWSGYLAASASLLTTELNALSSGSSSTLSTLGAEIDNSTNKYPLADVEFLAGGTYSPTAGGFLELWLLTPLDGTDYEDGSATVAPGRAADLIIPVRSGTSITPRAGRRGLILPPGLFKPLVRNQTGATLPSTGNTLSYRPYTQQY